MSELIELIQGCFNRFNPNSDYKTESNQFRISTVAYCSKRLYFDKIYPEKALAIDQKTLGIFAMGNAVHEFVFVGM